MKDVDFSYVMSSLELPYEIAQKEGLELEFISSLCINLMRGEEDVKFAADDALSEWDL